MTRVDSRVPHEDALGRVPHEDALGRVPHEDALGRVPHEDALGSGSLLDYVWRSPRARRLRPPSMGRIAFAGG